ncbi:MAG: Spy/CpxP family protein refolding chaperone [Gemmataceae bacterium]
MKRLVILSLLLLVATGSAQERPRYTEEQLKKLRELVNTTRETATELQGKLERHQRALAQLYDDYEFDEAKARRLQNAIVDLQRQLLENHLRMQTELRGIVDKDQFQVLKLRIKGAVQPQPKTTPNPQSNTDNKQPEKR